MGRRHPFPQRPSPSTGEWSGWCDGSAHEPWHVFEASDDYDRIYRAVGRTEAEARAKIEPVHRKRSRARLFIDDVGPVRCWRYSGQPDPHDYIRPDTPPANGEHGSQEVWTAA